LREHLDQVPASPDPKVEVLGDAPGPELLFGRCRHATKEEILAGLPPRLEADRIIDIFFMSMESHPSRFAASIEYHPLTLPAMLHKPTFLKEVRAHNVSLIWGLMEI
jgi:hypothetical protein